MTRTAWLRTGVGAAAVWIAGTAVAQNQIIQGNVLDANNRIGSGGLNAPRPIQDFNLTNRIMTGNAAGGMSFRGYSPIRDPGVFFLGSPAAESGLLGGGRPALPSDSLSNFQRDSFNLMDYRRATGTWGTANPYYSPSSTVLNTGAILSGQNRLGTSQIQNPYQPLGAAGVAHGTNLLGTVTDSKAGGNLLSVPTQVVRAMTGQPVVGSVDQRLLSNPLFAGAFRYVPAPQIAGQISPEQALAVQPRSAQTPETGEQVNVGETVSARLEGPLDLRLQGKPQDRRVGGPTDAAIQQVLARASMDGEFLAGQPGDASVKVPVAQKTAEDGVRLISPAPGPGEPGAVTDVYAWMIERTRPAASPGTPGTAQPGTPAQPAPAPNPTVVGALMDQSVEVVPLRTFVGTEDSAVNQRLKYAEEALRAGRYYRAAEAYDLARAISPRNALTLLGRSVSLLAAGDYVSSVQSLFETIGMFDALNAFEVDFRSFLPDLRVLDSRRADIEKRLEAREDGRLRFLLGFAEYN
ncbi:MAG TPA: hypothetical protein VLM89_04255, partial [Phycisphaerae bacterium]|nr:hypothetical protein [Phycisphaerae bacterium]